MIISNKLHISTNRISHVEGTLVLTLLALSFLVIGLGYMTERGEIPADPFETAPFKLGEELNFAMQLHNLPQMASALFPVMNVPLHLFSDPRTEVVVEFTQELELNEIKELERKGVEFHRMGDTISHIAAIYPVTIPWLLILALAQREDVLMIEWGYKKYYPELERSIPAIGANKVHTESNFGKGFSGKGIIIGMIDTGVYWQHPAFWNPDPDPAYEYLIVASNGQLFADIDKNERYSSNDKPIYFYGPTGQIADFLEIDKSGFNFGYDYLLLGGPTVDPPLQKPSLTQPWSGSFWAIPKDENGNKELDEGEHVIGLFQCKIRAFLNDSVEEVIMRQPDGWFYASPQSFGDFVGHGTHVAAIAVGGQLEYSAFTGVAPGADLVLSSTTWYLSDMIQELDWVTQQGVDVINLSLGSLFDGPLDGTSLFERIIDQLFEEQGIPTAIAGGNDNENSLHILGILPSGQTKRYSFVTFDPTSAKLREYFPDYPSGSYFIINALWEGEADLTFRVITPANQIIALGNYSNPSEGLNPVLNATWKAVSNYGKEKRMSRFYAPFMENVSLGAPEIGTGFALEVTNPSPAEVILHVYLSGDRGASGPWLAHWQESEPALDSRYLISSPATADRAIAVTSYVTTEWDEASGGPNGYKSNLRGEISKFASRGPRVDEAVNKPNIAAPGELILSAASPNAYLDVSPADLSGMWGTSMATPHVSGSIALIMEAFPEVKNHLPMLLDALYQNVNTEGVEGPFPNSEWGSGKLDTYKATLSLIGTVQTFPPTISTETPQESPGIFVSGFELAMAFSALVVTAILSKKRKRR
ncbi:MAG: S8 family serine peptidase [Candidatus Heimdallarchaeota archaeon]